MEWSEIVKGIDDIYDHLRRPNPTERRKIPREIGLISQAACKLERAGPYGAELMDKIIWLLNDSPPGPHTEALSNLWDFIIENPN